MPSVATGATLANRKLLAIGISGDGDTANIGIGQFKHACRRNVPMVYIIENNGCYGLTKGQFSATADLHAQLRRKTARRTSCRRSTSAWRRSSPGATFVARSFAGDKKQLRPAAQGGAAAPAARPCSTSSARASRSTTSTSSTKSWDWAKAHEEPLHEIGFVAHATRRSRSSTSRATTTHVPAARRLDRSTCAAGHDELRSDRPGRGAAAPAREPANARSSSPA